MRLSAGLGLVLLVVTACAGLPDGVRLEAGGRAIELKKSCPAPVPAPPDADAGQG